MTASTLAAAFVLGLLYGRRAKPQEVQVPPKIVYVPLAYAESGASGLVFNLEERLRLSGLAGGPLDEIIKVADELYSAMRRREECLQMLFLASKALNELRISPSTYRAITRRYLTQLVELEKAIEERQAALARALSWLLYVSSSIFPSRSNLSRLAILSSLRRGSPS